METDDHLDIPLDTGIRYATTTYTILSSVFMRYREREGGSIRGLEGVLIPSPLHWRWEVVGKGIWVGG